MPVASPSARTEFTLLGLYSRRHGSFAGKTAQQIFVIVFPVHLLNESDVGPSIAGESDLGPSIAAESDAGPGISNEGIL